MFLLKYQIKNANRMHERIRVQRYHYTLFQIQMLSKISRLLDFIYPANCHLCSNPLTHGRHLCEPCADSLHYVKTPFCSQCGECYDGSIQTDFICPNCHDLTLDFEFARAALKSRGMSRSLLHDFKYRRKIHLSDELGRVLQTGLDDPRFEPFLDHGILVPVPLHRVRLRKRKFNQSEELASSLKKFSALRIINALQRNRNTATQTRFSRAQRLKNLRGAFELKARYHSEIQGKNIILLDDVFTTGSTANECTRVMLAKGAKSVAVLTLLRG